MAWFDKKQKTESFRNTLKKNQLSKRKVAEIAVDKNMVRSLLAQKKIKAPTNKIFYNKKINFSKYNAPKINIFKKLLAIGKIKLFSIICTTLIISFLFYICFIDTIFVIKNYKITYQNNSYLHPREIQKYTKSLGEYKVFGIIPANQFWFINSTTATNIAKKTIPEVEEIVVTNEVWPNNVDLLVKVAQPLLTIKLFENNQLKYWQIAKDGRIYTENINRTSSRILTIQNRINLDLAEATLQDFQLQNNPSYLNKLYFIVYLWDILEKEIDLEISNTFIADFKDEDVVLVTENDTSLYFSANNFDKINQYQRVKKAFDSEIGVRESNKKLEYIDFRIPQKIFVKAR